MKKGTVIVGALVGFTYVGRPGETKWLKVTVRDADGKLHKGIAGEASLFDFPTMLSLKGAGAEVSMVYDGTKNGYAQYNSVEFSL
jgi:hypothetical protein